MRLDLRLDRQRQVDGHLVAVEVGVEALADQRVDADGVAFDQHRLERLDAHAVQRRGAVEQHRVVVDHLFEDVPDLVVLALEHLLGRLDRVGVAQLLEPADDERLEQLQRDLLGQAALVQLELRADDDDRAGRVVDALAEQVLAEAALLALDHVGQRLQRAVADEPSTGRLQRLLSNRASTACWSIRFSLRMMTSGALRSTSFLSRLLRLMMRR